jgi:hypothetical protein
MKKGKLFIGPAESGKTREARRIASELNHEKVTLISLHTITKKYVGNFFFSGCNKETELLILDDWFDLKLLDMMIRILEGFTVHKQGLHPFVINPNIILIADSRLTVEDFPVSITRYFDIVEFPITPTA